LGTFLFIFVCLLFSLPCWLRAAGMGFLKRVECCSGTARRRPLFENYPTSLAMIWFHVRSNSWNSNNGHGANRFVSITNRSASGRIRNGPTP
jgi:hypothetical protein